ncbi:MAG: bifunctional adenosylcobinamide kinase/adenosylcobinamide-phosphate guanylyltransferase [Anaerolineales bacterium]|nr:bifunctional adenosylcobinamide kinase/adenosylcobinamide-phosphate guanylyltransferase [Anaerolineales bacterium]
MGKLTLVLGGARSGKSTYAEKLAKQSTGAVVYIATAEPGDNEMVERIAKHKSQRPAEWETLEIPFGVGQGVRESTLQPEVFLLDCVTLLMSNLILQVTENIDQPPEEDVPAAVDAEIDALVDAIHSADAHWIVVSNEVGLGLVPPYPLGRVYRDAIGRANQRLSRVADEVFFLVAGMALPLHELGTHIAD